MFAETYEVREGMGCFSRERLESVPTSSASGLPFGVAGPPPQRG